MSVRLRSFMLGALLAVATAFVADADPICQKCVDNGELTARCWTLDPDHRNEAEWGACWEVPVFGDDGELVGEYCTGSYPSPDCYDVGGGGDGGGDPDDQTGGGGDSCLWETGCPAWCATCN